MPPEAYRRREVLDWISYSFTRPSKEYPPQPSPAESRHCSSVSGYVERKKAASEGETQRQEPCRGCSWYDGRLWTLWTLCCEKSGFKSNPPNQEVLEDIKVSSEYQSWKIWAIYRCLGAVFSSDMLASLRVNMVFLLKMIKASWITWIDDGKLLLTPLFLTEIAVPVPFCNFCWIRSELNILTIFPDNWLPFPGRLRVLCQWATSHIVSQGTGLGNDSEGASSWWRRR